MKYDFNYDNNSAINCEQCKDLYVYKSDDYGNYAQTSDFIVEKAYFYDNNSYIKEINFQQDLTYYSYILDCSNFTNDVFLLFKLSGNNDTAIFVESVKLS